MRFRPSPTALIAGAALFFALGGTGIAVSEAVKPQPRCAAGAIRGYALVTGDPTKGIANIPDQFTGAKSLFRYRFNCTGKGVQVRRTGSGVYEVRFVGNRAPVGVAAGIGGYQAAIDFLGPGTFKVTLTVTARDDEADVPFVIVAT